MPCTTRCRDKLSLWSLFEVFCFIAGQYINSKSKVISAAGLILFAIQAVIYSGHIVFAVAVEVFRVGNLSRIDRFETNNFALPEEYWKFSAAITVGSIASFLSYSLITCWILIPVNGILYYRKDGNVADEDDKDYVFPAHRKVFKTGKFISPFDDSDKLSGIETLCFFIKYLIVHIFFFGSLISSIFYTRYVYGSTSQKINVHSLRNGFNLARIVLHLFSQFCAIQSCFIFSKIVYRVTNKLEVLTRDLGDVNFLRLMQ